MTGKKQFLTIDAYIGSFPAATQVILAKMRQTIRTAVPEATETIRYQIPAFDRNGNHLVYFAGWKGHISMYPRPAGDAAFQRRIAPYKKAKSALHFPLDQPIPYDLIAHVVTLLVQETPEPGP